MFPSTGYMLHVHSLSVNERKDGLCYVDRQAINLHVYAVDIDHIIALARGGADDESNWALNWARYIWSVIPLSKFKGSPALNLRLHGCASLDHVVP